MVGILIVFYNDLDNITRLAKSITEQENVTYKTFVLDNNPALNHISILKEYLPDAVELKVSDNTGFAHGNNLLATEAIKQGCKYLWVLNPDMSPEPTALMHMVNFLNSNNAHTAVGPLLLYGNSNRKIQLFGGSVNFKTQKKELFYSNKFLKDVNLPEVLNVSLLNGGSFLIRSEFVTKNYLFEVKYFLYNDEIDLFKRIIDSGGKVAVISNSIISHHHNWNKTNKQGYNTMYYYMMRNKFIYYHKFNLNAQVILEALKQIVLFPVIARFCYKTSGLKLIYYYYLGVWHGINKKDGISSVSLNT